MMTRDEHLAWCKTRALQYVDAGLFDQAAASMGSDLLKHPETIPPPEIIWAGALAAASGDPEFALRRWIEGFK